MPPQKFLQAIDKKIGLALILLFFLLFQSYSLYRGSFVVHGDNALYMYMARQLSRGIVPYRDFFFAHPPLMIAPTALLLLLLGESFSVGMIQPILGGLGCIILTYLISEKIRPGSGLFSAALLAVSHHFLFFSHWLGGVSLVNFFLLLSLYLTLREKHGLSGVSLVLSFLARINHFPVLLVFLGYNLYKKNRRFFLGFGLAALASALLLLVPGFFNSTVLYHISKKAGSLSIGYVGYYSFARFQWSLIALSLLSIPYALGRKIRNQPLLFTYLASASALILLLLSEVRVWYIVYAIPFLALSGGFLLAELSDFRINKKSMRLPAITILLILLLIGVLPAYSSTNFSQGKTYDPVYDLLEIGEGDYLLDTLAGMGPYLALKNGASISGEMVDLNPLRFANNLIDTDDAIARLRQQPPKYIFDLRGGTGDLISWDHYWRFTPLRSYVYDSYQPHFLVYNEDHFTMTLIWEPQSREPVPEFEFHPALYSIKFLNMHEIVGRGVDTHYLTATRASTEADLELGDFVDGLTKITLNKRQLIAHNAWDLSNPHTTVYEGNIRSETWITPHGSHYLIFTETTEDNITVSFTAMDFVPADGQWQSLVIYENIIGGLVPTYSEQRIGSLE